MQIDSNLSSEVVPSRPQVIEDVKSTVAEHMGIAPGTIRESSNLETDIGCDSLDLVEIMMEVEEHFDIDVPDEISDEVDTIGDVADGVLGLLGRSVPDQ